MEISSKELGRILIAFGTTLLGGTGNSNEEVLPIESRKESTIIPTPQITETVVGSFETPDNVKAETSTTTLPDVSLNSDNSNRIAELELELAKLQTQQNQSGLDLKQIKL